MRQAISQVAPIAVRLPTLLVCSSAIARVYLGLHRGEEGQHGRNGDGVIKRSCRPHSYATPARSESNKTPRQHAALIRVLACHDACLPSAGDG